MYQALGACIRSTIPKHSQFVMARAPSAPRKNIDLDVAALDGKHQQAESSYIGPSGIKLRVSVSHTFYTWQTSAPTFRSCFDLAPHLPRPLRLRAKSTDRGDVEHDSTSSLPDAHQTGHKRPRSTSESAFHHKRPRGTSMSFPVGPDGEAEHNTRCDSTALHASAVAIELSTVAMRSDSWFTSSLIDAVLHKLALSYPHVHFMPCEFMAWMLPSAAKKGRWTDFAPVDMLSRSVCIEADAIAPAYEPPAWYHPLPTRVARDGVKVEHTSASVDANSAPVPASLLARTRSSGLHSGSSAAHDWQSVQPCRLPNRAFTPMERLRYITDGAQYVSLVLAVMEGYDQSVVRAGDVLDETVESVRARLESLLGQRHPVSKDVDLYAVVHLALAHSQQQTVSAAGAVPSKQQIQSNISLPAVWSPHLSYKRPAGYVAPQYRSTNKPIVLCWHERANHWLTIVVHTGTAKRIEVYEPFGKTARKQAHTDASRQQQTGIEVGSEDALSSYSTVGLSLRNVPLQLLQWLDAVCPLPDGSWRGRSSSAITTRHQINGYDCGPAALLYAEKVASGLTAHTISAHTEQSEISSYRDKLKGYLQGLQASAATAIR